jgi:hypothetical protein
MRRDATPMRRGCNADEARCNADEAGMITATPAGITRPCPKGDKTSKIGFHDPLSDVRDPPE